MSQKVIDYGNMPHVSLDFMNRDHREAVDLLNQLGNCVAGIDTGESSPKEISQVFAQLVQHHKEHFDGEKEEMIRLDFPAQTPHIAEHERAIGQMQAELEAWKEQGDLPRLKSYVEKVLPGWLMNHIVTMDTVMAAFLARLLESGELQGSRYTP